MEDWREYCGTKTLREPDVYIICDLEITCYSENKEKWNIGFEGLITDYELLRNDSL